jgi:hypothetical protein
MAEYSDPERPPIMIDPATTLPEVCLVHPHHVLPSRLTPSKTKTDAICVKVQLRFLYDSFIKVEGFSNCSVLKVGLKY